MPHARQQIRDAVVTAVTGLPTTGARVYPSRVYPSGDAHLPGLCVYTLVDELLARSDAEAGHERRRLTVIVEARSKPGTAATPDDQLDDIVAEVGAALMSDPTLAGRVGWLQMESAEMTLDGSLERPAGVAVMSWSCVYQIDSASQYTLIEWETA